MTIKSVGCSCTSPRSLHDVNVNTANVANVAANAAANAAVNAANVMNTKNNYDYANMDYRRTSY
jgi:phosphoribosylcarboxyaminoimidazole (NCAIR) mutase